MSALTAPGAPVRTGAFTSILRCERCGTEYPEPASPVICARCDAEGVHVYPWPVYDLARVTALPATSAGPGMLRFASLLPLDSTPLTSLGEGGTPLLAVPRAGAAVGLPHVYVKDEARNPTWSYKDRLAVVAVNRAAQRGAETVVVSSTGNHGAAVAAYAARLGLRCIVLTLESVPLAMKALIQSYGAEVVATRAPLDRWTIMRAGVEQRGWVPMSGYASPPSGSNPIGLDGYKTIAYELWEQMARVPDVVVAPVAYGDGVAGILRGFRDLVDLGFTDRVPRIVAAEPHGPFEAGLADAATVDTPRPAPAEASVAFSIASLLPSWQGLWALRESRGGAASATNDEIMAAQRALAATEGLFPEASSAITYAVLPQLVERGLVSADESVVLLSTSTGLKDIPATAERLPAVPVVEPTLAALDEALAAPAESGLGGSAA